MLKRGLILLCPLLLSACASGLQLPAAPPIDNGCPRVIPCALPPANPKSNEGLSDEVDQLEQAWHACAAQVDMIVDCQRQQEQSQHE
ncbi:Rz1-like lysis system protein LysC [Shewanella sp.]|uniref:Rz1-like lysis system protein LysC n=1 Tax=Shewanella sp. TaxID=50422 RepID=UPI003A977565